MKPIILTLNKHLSAKHVLSVACFSMVLVAALLYAPSQSLAAEQRSSIEEVIVTAEKRSETLQEIPLSVTAFTADDLDAHQVVEAGEIVNKAPGVLLRKQAASHSNYSFGIRGVTSGETQLAIDSVVAVYVDDVYLGRLTGAAFDISDTERVEVLRGPQGTLYGRNATGGAINIISSKPDGAPGIRNHFSGGERGFWRNQLTVNTGAANIFGGKLMMRLNHSKWNHRGFLRNDEGPSAGYIGDQDSESSRAYIRFEGDKFTANYIYTNSVKTGNSQIPQLVATDDFTPTLNALGPTSLIGADATIAPNNFWTNIGNSPYVNEDRLGAVSKFYASPESSDIEAHTLSMEWNLPKGYKFRSVTGYRDWDSRIDNLGTDFGSFGVTDTAVAGTPAVPGTSNTAGTPAIPGVALSRVVDHLNVQPHLQKHTAASAAACANPATCSAGDVVAGQAVSLFTANRSSEQEQFTQEFQLSGTSFNDKLDWVLGFYYFEEKAEELNQQYTAVPGSALPLVGGVASAFDASHSVANPLATLLLVATLGTITAAEQQQLDELLALQAGAVQVETAVTAQLAPALAANRLTQAQVDAMVRAEVEKFYGDKGGFDALGATFQGRGSDFLCSGDNTRTLVDIVTDAIDLSTGLGLDPGSVTVAPSCDGVTVLGGTDFFDYGTENESFALYWHGRVSIIDSVTLSIGTRYTEDQRDAYLRSAVVNGGDRLDTGNEWDNFSWDFSVDWQIIPEVNFYGRIANSYRSGGYNARVINASEFLTPFDEENITSFELGVKTQFADNKVRINAAFFTSDFTDAQVSTFQPSLGGAGAQLTNFGELTLSGFELELLAIPFTGFTIGLNLGILDTDYDQFAEGNPRLMAQLGTNEPTVPYAPESNWAFHVDYQFPTYSWGQIGLRLDADYSDSFTISPTVPLDDPINEDTERTLVNLSVTLSKIPIKTSGDFSVSLWSRNVTNEEYRTFTIPFGTFSVATYGELRRSGFDLVYTY